MSDEQGKRLQRVGVLWKPKPGAKSKGSGSITIGTLRQRFVILPNDHKAPGSNDPDYLLLSSGEPEADPYARQPRPTPAPAGWARAPGRHRMRADL